MQEGSLHNTHKLIIQLTNIEMFFLPKNSTSRHQPLDAGIKRSFKAKFYNYQLSLIVNKISEHENLKNLSKAIT